MYLHVFVDRTDDVRDVALLSQCCVTDFNTQTLISHCRSYKNPHKADILATFPDPIAKTVTVLGMMYRNYVPSPYFFKTYNAPFLAVERSGTPHSEPGECSYRCSSSCHKRCLPAITAVRKSINHVLLICIFSCSGDVL